MKKASSEVRPDRAASTKARYCSRSGGVALPGCVFEGLSSFSMAARYSLYACDSRLVIHLNRDSRNFQPGSSAAFKFRRKLCNRRRAPVQRPNSRKKQSTHERVFSCSSKGIVWSSSLSSSMDLKLAAISSTSAQTLPKTVVLGFELGDESSGDPAKTSAIVPLRCSSVKTGPPLLSRI